MFVILPDPPSVPTLATSPADPTDGDNVELTCTSSTTTATKYEFKKGGKQKIN